MSIYRDIQYFNILLKVSAPSQLSNFSTAFFFPNWNTFAVFYTGYESNTVYAKKKKNHRVLRK